MCSVCGSVFLMSIVSLMLMLIFIWRLLIRDEERTTKLRNLYDKIDDLKKEIEKMKNENKRLKIAIEDSEYTTVYFRNKYFDD